MRKEDLYRFIAARDLGVLGSISAAGTPECALVGIAVTEELEIIFDTVRSSRKYSNLRERPAAAFVIGLDGKITLQYEGEAWEPTGEDLAHYQAIYFNKLLDGRERLQWPGITYFVVRPRWIRYSDFNDASRGVVEMTF